jgi:hypothetical protein
VRRRRAREVSELVAALELGLISRSATLNSAPHSK